MSTNVPGAASLDGLEEKWSAVWEREGTYRFDRTKTRDEIYAIDTPPPTVSGSLHVGHVFSYTHTDCVARFHRMRGREVFYPMGWDDNGLPTERRVENHFGVRCDPSLHYDPELQPPGAGAKQKISVSRPNFVELCHRLTAEDEKAFERLWRRLGLSVDWSLTYATIDERSQRVSQRAFLRNLARGEAYRAEAPTLWDVDFRTAVAQAELVDREVPGAYHRLRFRRAGEGSGAAGAKGGGRAGAGADPGGAEAAPGAGNGEGGGGEGGGEILVDTTRPELVPACVALVAHPDDERYRPLFGTEAVTPLFGVRVPVLAHELADPDKGTGIAMVCTFGDLTDVTWWRELNLPVRPVLGHDGRLRPVQWSEAGWECDDGERAESAYRELAGRTARQAQTRIVELLRESGELDGEPRPITHPVKFFEKGDRPLEIVTSHQWYLRNGGRSVDLREEMLDRGRQLEWHPGYMGARYQSWVEGLNGDWLVSRQRWFGVPFPVWYPVGDDGSIDHDHPLVPDENRLPVDPSTDVPDGYEESQRDQPGGFAADPDVMDTWATSSLSPQIATGWEDDDDLFSRTFPMDLRPQAHDIIRTWLFSTVLRAHLEHDSLPWAHAAISGWVLDPDRKKMSKSVGNVVTPMPLLEEHGADAVRYWAASGRPGTDTAFDPKQMKVGRKLAIKLLNASRFALSRMGPGANVVISGEGTVTAPLDAALLSRLATVVDGATRAFEAYDYARALELTETFFWAFCDDYIELVKGRAYGSQGPGGAASAGLSLSVALSTLLRLFAPFLVFTAEEVWSWWQEGSVHRAPWPEAAALRAAAGPGDEEVLDAASWVLGAVNKAKSEAKRSVRSPVALLLVGAPTARLAALRRAEADVLEAGSVAEVRYEEANEPSVSVELAEDEGRAAG